MLQRGSACLRTGLGPRFPTCPCCRHASTGSDSIPGSSLPLSDPCKRCVLSRTNGMWTASRRDAILFTCTIATHRESVPVHRSRLHEGQHLHVLDGAAQVNELCRVAYGVQHVIAAIRRRPHDAHAACTHAAKSQGPIGVAGGCRTYNGFTTPAPPRRPTQSAFSIDTHGARVAGCTPRKYERAGSSTKASGHVGRGKGGCEAACACSLATTPAPVSPLHLTSMHDLGDAAACASAQHWVGGQRKVEVGHNPTNPTWRPFLPQISGLNGHGRQPPRFPPMLLFAG
jgi:hypothetical protein